MTKQSRAENRKQFACLCERLRAFAIESGGQFQMIVGLDPREIDSLQSPLLQNLVGPWVKLEGASGSSLNWQIDAAYENAVIGWLYEGFFIQLQARFLNADFESAMPQTIRFRCVIKPKSRLSLRLLSGLVGHGFSFGKGESVFGRPASGLVKILSPNGFSKTLEQRPESDYYVPFGDSVLDRKCYLRAYPVSLGNAFAASKDIRKILEKTATPPDFMVGAFDFFYGGEENVIWINADANTDNSQLSLFLLLIFRTLDLLGTRWLEEN